MSKEIDIQLKRQLQNTPKVIKNFLETSIYREHVVYYVGNWGQDLIDNLTAKQAEKVNNQIHSLSRKVWFTQKKLPEDVGGYEYWAIDYR